MVLNKWCKSNIKQLGYQAIVFKRNTIAEPVEYKGINHLIEHCMCGQFPKIEYILQKNGIEYNAYTSDTEVVFYISGLNKNVNKVSELFFDNVVNCDVTEQLFNREKDIVIQEYIQTFTQQERGHIFNTIRQNYNHCSTIGYKQSLENISYDQFVDYKNKYFNEPDYRYFISNKQPKDVELLNNRSDFNSKLTNVVLGQYDTFDTENITTVKENSHILFHTVVNFNDNVELYYCLKFLMVVLQNGLTSPLINELRLKRGLVYNVSCGIQRISDNQGIMMIHTSTDKNNVGIVVKTIDRIINNLSKYIKRTKFNYNKQCILLLLKQMNVLNYDDNSQFNKLTVDYHDYIYNICYERFINICEDYFKHYKMMLHIDGE